MKPSITRMGRTHKLIVGKVSVYITVNRGKKGQIIECFGKAGGGLQGHVDMVCRIASLAIQGRGNVPTLIRHMRFDKTPPVGGPGQPKSIYDAIAIVLQEELERGK